MNKFAELNGGVAFGGNVFGGSVGADAVPEGTSELFASAWRDSGGDWFSREQRNLRVRKELERERLKEAEVLRAVWVYDEDADSRKLVDGSGKYGVYASGRARLDERMLPVYGRDYAEVVMPRRAGEPWECIEAQLKGMDDEGRKAKYRREFEGLKVKGGDTADDYYGLLGRMVRDDVRSKWDAQQARIKAVQESLGRMDAYVRGDEFGESFSEQDLANVRSVTDADVLADAEAVRSWMRTYMQPLSAKDDAEEILRTVDALEYEFYEVIRDNPRRAELAYNAMMHWAEGLKQSGKVGVTDEFIVGVGKKLSNWGKAAHVMAPAVAMAPVGHPDFPIMLSDSAMAGQQAELAYRHQEYAWHANARSILRAAINKSLELGDNVSWWKGAARTAAQMAGDSSAYLLPGIGAYTGTADLLVGGATETVDRFSLQGLSGSQAAGQAAIETGVQALVELTPWGRVGGKGLSSFTRRYFGDAIEKGTAGKLSRWVVRNTQNSTARALLAEGTASFVDEGILEPLAGGLLTYGAEQVADGLGIPHAQSREFTECFDELKALYTDPYQAAGLFLFTAGLTGAGAYGVHQNVKYFAHHRKMWEATGLTPEQVDRVMAADDRVELGGKLVREGWETDPAGMRERVLKVNKDFAERGEVLVLTGEGALDAELENSELAPAYRAVWQEYQDKGLLPKVEAVGENQFHITKEGVDITLDARGADAYLQHAIDEAEGVMLKEARTAAEKAEGVNLRDEIGLAVSRIAGGAALRTVAKNENSGIAVKDLVAGLPDFLAAPILAKGQVTLADAKAISEWAKGQIRALVEGGASDFDARMTRPEAEGIVRSLGEWSTFAEDFATRERVAKMKEGTGAISVGRYRGQQAVRFNGREVMGQVIMGLKGRVSHYGAVEDITESVTDMMLQERAAVLVEQGEAGSMAEGERMALEELADVVRRARAVVMKADPDAEIEEVDDGVDLRMGVMEALSTMARAKFLSSGVVPKWMQALTSGLKGIVGTGMAVEKVRAAYAEVLRKDPNALAGLEKMLADMGVYVQDAMREARIEAVDIQAWKSARAIVGARAAGPLGVGGAAVSDAVQEAERVEEEIVEAESKQEVLPVKSAAEVAAEAKKRLDEMVPGSNAPAAMKGVFVDDKCYYNEAGGFWCGMIAKEKLSDGTEQVKVGAKGKHGVIQGKELTGNFQQNVGAIYVWKRKDGSLQVISGRHRFAKLMEDAGARYCNCYVFEEDAEHDEKWARMLDYENNMRDDQADEVTAATYVRETGLPDEVLKERGLMRNDSRSKRGIFIGRHARQELWTRFVNGAVKPKDAQTICELTRSVKAEDRIDEIQGKCCMLLDTGKSWEYIGGMVQLMASKEAQMKQGLLDFGADFMEDLARAAEWIEKCVHKVDAAIKMLRNGRKMSGEMREEALRLGVQTETDADSEEVLRDLQLLRKKFELIGSYPDLVAQAQMWDGKSDVDPVGYYLENARKERIEAQLEGEMTADEYLAEQARKVAAESVPALFTMEMYKARTGSEKFAPDARGKEPVLSVNVHAVLADGSKATKNDLIADEDGSVFWGRLPELEALKDKGYAALDIIMRLGGKSDGFKHIVHKHGQWIMDAMGIDDPVRACKMFIAEVLAEVRKIQYQQNKGKDALLLKQGEAQRYFIVVIGKDRVEPNFAAIRTAFVASEPGRFDSEISLYEGEEALELRIPMSSFGENQRFRGASERQDRSSDYPDTAATSPSEDIMPQVGRVVKHEELISYKNNSFSASMDEPVENHVSFSIRTKKEPKKKGIGYKVFYRKDGKLYPPMVANPGGEDTPVGVWLDADEGVRAGESKTGRPQVKAGGKGTQGGSGTLAYRPGWHLGKIPYALQFNRKNPVTGERDLFPKDFVWAEVEYAADVDYQEEAMGYGVNKNGKFQHSLAGLPRIPEDGYYEYRTNPNPATDPWIITGAMKVKRVLTRSEVDELVRAAGRVPQKVEGDSAFSASMERNLAAVHSLSAEKFLAALELGGMPMPSVAVTRLDRPYDWGGAGGIVLVGRPELVDPKKRSKVYMHDAYTGKVPPVMYRKKNKAAIERLRADALDKIKPYGLDGSDGLNTDLFRDNYNEQVMDGYAADWSGNRAMMAYWAITVAGYAPKPKMKEPVGMLKKELYKVLKPWEKMLPRDTMLYSYHYTDEILDKLRDLMVRYYEGTGEEKLAGHYRNISRDNLQMKAQVYVEAVRKFTTKKVPDAVENGKRFVAYAEKHRKAYKSWCEEQLVGFCGEKIFSRKFVRKNWRGEVVDEWWGHEAYNLKNLMRYMREEKSRGGEMSSMSPGMFLACVAEEMRSIKDMQARRERVVGGEMYEAAKNEYEEAYSTFEKLAYGLKKPGWDSYFEISESALWRLLELVQGGRNMPSREMVERKLNESKDGWTDEHVDAAMDLLSKAITMPSDYMEAVPQRAVKMDEWEYAVLPLALKKNKAVMAGLRENGIVPRFHDGTEEGRKAALAGLVNDSKVSFSVIGPKAETWDKYADRAFKGRDDGKMRAEIDASGAKLKPLTGAAAYDYQREVENVPDYWRKRYARWLELDALFDAVYYSDEEPTEEQRAEAAAAEEEYYMLTEEVKDMMEALIERGGAWPSYTQLEAANKQALRMGMVRSIVAGKVDEAVYEKLGALSAGEKIYSLEDVLDFPELYEAYPMLKLVPVQFELLGGYNGMVTNYAYGAEYSIIKMRKQLLENADEFRSTLLHEVQHVIQRIEGYAKGGNVEGVYKHMKEELEYNEAEMKRLAKELRWFSALDYAKDYLKSARRLLRFPNAWKYNGLRYRHWKAALGNEDMTRLLVDDIAEQYEELRKSDEFETKRRGNWIKPVEYALPMVDFSDLAGVERGLAALEGLKSRRSAFRGSAPKKDKEYVKLMKYTNAAKRMLDKYEMEPYELYRRLAGEIEARNVQERRDWTMAERLARPFNETLEYPGEALVTFSMERASLQALDVLRTRADEREGERLMNDWQKACEGWAQLHVGGDDSRLGNGAKMLGEIHALIGATKGVLPEKYARMGHLNGLLRWAAVYAQMQQTGEVPAEGVIAGPIYEKFVERMRYVDAKNEAYGLNDAEVKEAMALLAGERLDVAMLKVARECKRRLEWFLKDRERERIDWVVERAYPKREKGKRTPRGKMDAESYRRIERAYRLMAMEANDLAGLMNLIKSALDKMKDEPAEAVTVLRSLRGGDVPGVDEVEALEAELEDELFLAQTFGCWENMAFEQARRASGAMAELVLLGRNAWQSKLRAERRRAAFDRDDVSRHFGTKLEDVQAERGDKTAKEKGRKRTAAMNLVKGMMSYSHQLIALESKLGKRFTGRHMRMIAEAHEKIMMENQRRHRWMYNTLRDITGLETEGEIEEWMQKNNEIIDTGIDLDMPMKTTCRLTPEEAKMWLSLTAEERQKKRDEMGVEAAKKREKPDNVPGEDVMGALEEKLMEAEQADAMPKEFVFTTEWSYKSRLKCTREALLYAILTFEQEDYEHLLEANGLTQAKLQQMRKLVGKELLRWGYAMRKELSEHGKMVAELYEAYTGVPFGQRQNYFRGVFDVARAKDAGEAVDQVSGVTGGKYGILIARQYHNQQLNWSTSASLVFVSTMKEQQNYIATAHITREWRTLLNDRLFERRLRAEIGDTEFGILNGWLTMIDGAALADVKVNAMLNNTVGKLPQAYAVSRLAGNAYTIMKQASALLNGFVGGYVPERVLAGNELVQELTYRHVGFGEYMAALGKALAGQTEITMKEIEAAGFITGRKKVEGSHIEEAAMLSPWQKVPGKVGRKARAIYEGNMDAIGFVDRKANAKAALALAEVVYQQAKKENADGLVPDAELRRVAIETARMMVDRAAQPQLRTQKGYLAAGGGAFGAMGNFFYMFKSETLNKIGLFVAQMLAGQHRTWIVGALSFGVMNSIILALIDWICGRWYDDDEEKWEKRAKSFAGNVLFNDIATVPLLGELPDWLRGKLVGDRHWASNSLVAWGTDTWKYGEREWKNIDKGASWDKHVTALCSLARSVGALSGMGLSGHNAAVGSCCELTLAAASLSNTVRFVKDVVKKVVGE